MFHSLSQVRKIFLTLNIFFLVLSAFLFSSQAFAQDRLDLERFMRLSLVAEDQKPEIDLSGKVFIQDATYGKDKGVEIDVFIPWFNAEGRFIPEIMVAASLLYRDENSTVGNETVFRTLQSKTDNQGVVRFSMPFERGRFLAPGQYTLKVEIPLRSQAEEVQTLMLSHPNLFGSYLNSDGERVKIQSEEEKQAAFQRLLADYFNPPQTMGKLFVLEDQSFWLDDGSLGACEEIILRERNIDDLRKELDEAKKAKASQSELKLYEQNLKEAVSSLELAGGKLSKQEEEIFQAAQKKRGEARASILRFQDKIIAGYLEMLEGDLKYWRWKSVELYGYALYTSLESGKFPWEQQYTLDDSPFYIGKQAQDLSSWRKYLIEKYTIAVKGGSLYSKNQAGKWEKDQASKIEGGEYSELLLDLMIQDIKAFDPEKYLEKIGKKMRIQEENWQEFERLHRVLIGLESDAEGQQKPLQFRTFKSNKQKLSTVERLDLLTSDGAYYNNLPFPNSFEKIRSAFEALSLFPMSCRYTYYTNLLELEGDSLDEALGDKDVFPVEARLSAHQKDSQQNQAANDIYAYLKIYDHPVYALWYWEEGPGRTHSQAAEKAKAALANKEERYEKVKVYKSETQDEGESDLVVKSGGTGGSQDGE